MTELEELQSLRDKCGRLEEELKAGNHMFSQFCQEKLTGIDYIALVHALLSLREYWGNNMLCIGLPDSEIPSALQDIETFKSSISKEAKRRVAQLKQDNLTGMKLIDALGKMDIME